MAGAPKGNQNARKAKDWEKALRRALANFEDASLECPRGEALYRAAFKVVRAAVSGDFDAIEHIACRLDGKATEHVVGEIHHHHTSSLTDDELAAIASGSSEGAAEPSNGAPGPSGIH